MLVELATYSGRHVNNCMATKIEKAIASLGIASSLTVASVSPVPLPTYDEFCAPILQEVIDNGGDFSQDPDWQTKVFDANSCTQKFWNETFSDEANILVVDLDQEFTATIQEARIHGGTISPAYIAKKLLKYHIQASKDIGIERPTIIKKLVHKSVITIDDEEFTLEDVKALEK